MTSNAYKQACSALRRLVNAVDNCENTRGRFSCVEPHDSRCPKARADSPEMWRGEWECLCGSDELEDAVKMASELLINSALPTEEQETSAFRLLQRIADKKDSPAWWADLDRFLNAPPKRHTRSKE